MIGRCGHEMCCNGRRKGNQGVSHNRDSMVQLPESMLLGKMVRWTNIQKLSLKSRIIKKRKEHYK